jgi:hypothetical protein
MSAWDKFVRDNVRAEERPGRCPECDLPLDEHDLNMYCCGAWSPTDGGDGCDFCRWRNQMVELKARFDAGGASGG